ncbi:MAG: S41 family peptidase [Panacibacter sp.]
MRRKKSFIFIKKTGTKQYSWFAQLFSVVFLVAVFLTSCVSVKKTAYNPSTKLPPEAVKEDFAILRKTLEANHPSLYWYTSKDSIDIYYNQAFSAMSDSLTETQFKNKTAWFISKIRCGHTSVRPSKVYAAYSATHRNKQFPLYLKVWGDTIAVIGNLNRGDSMLKRGTIIKGVEGFNNRVLLDSMFQFISTDGYGDNFKNQVISFNFPLYYSYAFPIKDSFAISYIDSVGNTQQLFVKAYKPVKDTTKPTGKPMPGPSHEEIKKIELLSKRSLNYDTSGNLAYMRLATFSGGRLRNFFKKSFEELKQKKIPNLVIDLRENSGGSIGTAANFSRYLKNSHFHVADTAAAVNRSLTYGNYIHPMFLYRIAMRLTTRKKADGKFHFTALEQHLYKPYQNLHYNGNVYVLQGGYTFSAAAMFILGVKGQSNVTIVGEETGGGNYGTSAVHLPAIILPNSGIQITLPLYRLVPDRSQIHNGRGIQPDVLVEPSTEYIRKGVDHKMEVIKELIKEKKK